MKPSLTPEQQELIFICSLNEYRDAQSKGEAGIVAIAPFLFTHAIISGVCRSGHEDRWCYHTYEKAKAALDAWDGTGEPREWHRHPSTDRRPTEQDWQCAS